MEGDSSPPLGARRRFSALMDTHRFASPLEGDVETQPQQSGTKSRGSSVEGTTAPSSPSSSDQSTSVKEAPGVSVGGEEREDGWTVGINIGALLYIIIIIPVCR